MNKEEFLRNIDTALGKISREEREEILYDYEEHFMVGREKGKTEEEICLELGNPTEIANNYLLNLKSENTQAYSKEEAGSHNSLNSEYNRRNLFAVIAITAVVLICSFVGYAAIQRHNNSGVNMNSDGIQVGGIRIDSSGVHGDGISIDSNGVKVPGVTVDSNGVKAPGISIDENGVKAPGVNIDGNGVKINLPNVDIELPEVNIGTED